MQHAAGNDLAVHKAIMSSANIDILLALTLLWTKHTIADYFLQSLWQVTNKCRYGHPGGLLHALIHVALTPIVFLVLPMPAPAIVGYLLLGEYVIHYHLDWAKEKTVRTKGWGFMDAAFWRAFGIDQYAHFLTYIGMIVFLSWI